jgi:hypothetical protein
LAKVGNPLRTPTAGQNSENDLEHRLHADPPDDVAHLHPQRGANRVEFKDRLGETKETGIVLA